MKDNKILKFMQAAEKEKEESVKEDGNEPEVEVGFFSSVGNEVTDHIKKLFSKNDGKTSVVSQEFLGFGKKYKILSNVDFEASLKQSEISKRYDSVNELKEALSVLSIFENDVCECLSRNNDGFSIEFDPEEVVYALKDIKQGDGPSDFLKVLKSLKTKSSFEEMKEVKSDVYEREFSIEKGQQSINYYKNDCLNVIDNCYKNSENDPKHKNTVNRIKEFVKIGEAEIKAAEECLQLLFKYIKVEKA